MIKKSTPKSRITLATSLTVGRASSWAQSPLPASNIAYFVVTVKAGTNIDVVIARTRLTSRSIMEMYAQSLSGSR